MRNFDTLQELIEPHLNTVIYAGVSTKLFSIAHMFNEAIVKFRG